MHRLRGGLVQGLGDYFCARVRTEWRMRGAGHSPRPAARRCRSQKLHSSSRRDRGDGRSGEFCRAAAARACRIRGDVGLDPPQPARPLGGRRRPVRDQSVPAPVSGCDVSRHRAIERAELLAVDGLHIRRQRALGNRRRDLAAFSERSNRQRYRGLVPGRAAVSYLPSPAGARRQRPGHLADTRVGARFPACRHQSTPRGQSRGLVRARRRAVLRHPCRVRGDRHAPPCDRSRWR